MLSKLKSGGAPEGRRVTRQMTATALDSRNPLHIPEILENVLEFLLVDDLKACRLVNSTWKDIALKPMKKKSAQISFREHLGFYGLKDMERFLQCFANPPGSGSTGECGEFQREIPCTKFQLYTDILNEHSSDRDKSTLAKFLLTISHCATEITLENKGNDFDDFLQGLVEQKFPYLKKSTFSSHSCSGKGIAMGSGTWMSVFIKNSPRLETISFWAYRVTAGNPRDPAIPSFFDVLQENHGLNINNLSIAVELENEDLLKLKSCGLKLNCLSMLAFNSWQEKQLINHLVEFLEGQRESLNHLLILNPYEFPLQDFTLPNMKNLNSLIIQWGSAGMVNYRARFPALQTVILHRLNQNNWLYYLQPEMQPTETVTGLSLSHTDPSVEAIFEAVRIFPRVIRLKMSAFPLGLPIVYKSWRNLKELTLCTQEGSCIDRLLTGLDEDGYKEALRRMRNWTPKFDESGIRIGFDHGPISVLRHLKVLRLDAREQHGTQLEITKVSICLALMKMPSLMILDLGARLRSPELSIPSRVLNEFKKNRLILWKLKHVMSH